MNSTINRIEAKSPQIASLADRMQNRLAARQPKVLVIGDVMLDEYIEGSVDRISPEAPIPVMLGQSTVQRPGGAASVAANIVRLGGEVTLEGLVGDDNQANDLIEVLAEYSVSKHSLVAVPGRKTTRKLRVLAGSQQIVRIDFEDRAQPSKAIDDQRLADLKPVIEANDIIVISDYEKGACGAEFISSIVSYAAKIGKKVLVDPKGKDYHKYSGAFLIKPNKKEISEVYPKRLHDLDEIRDAAQWLARECRLQACLVTLGPEGMLLCEDGVQTQIGAHAHEVADVTGAGDAVMAVVALSVGCGLSVLDSCILANAAATLAVMKRGNEPVELMEIVEQFDPEAQTIQALGSVELDELMSRIQVERRNGATVVFTNGCFDVLHMGHISLLERAGQMGTFLIVGLNSDSSTRRLKGNERPIFCQSDRAAQLAAIRHVHAVTIFDEDTPEDLIRTIKPDVLVKGADYARDEVVGRDIVESYGGKVELVELKSNYSTTALVTGALSKSK